MKTLSTISAAALLATTIAIPAWAGPVGMERPAPQAQANTTQTQVDPELIQQLQEASAHAVQEAGTGNKKLAFERKAYQIDQLIERLKGGEKVDPSEIEQALQPVWVW